jgi:signal transduction histidine kinase
MPEEHDPRANRFEVTGYAALEILLVIPMLATFVLFVVSCVLVIIWVGIPLLLAVIPAMRALANLQRRIAGRTLGQQLSPSYLPTPERPFARFTALLSDPMTWRDLLWLLWAMTVGFLVSLVLVVLMLGIVTTPIWWFGAVHIARGRAAVDRALLGIGRTEALEARVRALAASRAGVVDHSAAELRRIERDLHDGPQARLAALSLSLGLADDALDRDPDLARELINEARRNSSTALGEIRDVVRGIHPPVLADRGVTGAVEALALDMAIPVDIEIDVPGPVPAPIESAVYFAIAECLANVGKHADATRAWVSLRHADRTLAAVVGDDGVGGADPGRGSGIAGIIARLGAFDGTLELSSPVGGPTTITMEVPCELSSPKTTRSSGRA